MTTKEKNIVARMKKKQPLLESLEHRVGKAILFIKDPLTNEVQIADVIEKFRSSIPDHLMDNIDYIYVGQFAELKKREVDSLYYDGTIYITNEQDSTMDMVTNLVHEVAHGIEEANGDRIYADGRLFKEYLAKKRAVLQTLASLEFEVEEKWATETKFNAAFDEFLYNTVGYQMLATQSASHFISPYAVTSVREYFAVAFEEYFLGRTYELKQISPTAYDKIDNLF